MGYFYYMFILLGEYKLNIRFCKCNTFLSKINYMRMNTKVIVSNKSFT